MPRGKKSAVPGLYHHKPTNRAKSRIGGQDIYLGPWGSPEADEAYRRLVAEYLAAPIAPPSALKGRTAGLTVVELILAYAKHRDEEKARGLPGNDRLALAVLRKLYGRTRADGFGPLKLIACRKEMIQAGLCRKEVNRRVAAIKRAFRWGVAMELVPGEVWHALAAVEGLRQGHGGVREGKKVRPVPDAHVEAACKELAPVLAALVRFVRLTGCRVGEACSIRLGDLDRSCEVWSFRPEQHKKAYIGRVRIIKIGPKAQAEIEPLLEGLQPDDPIFSPTRAMEARAKVRRAARRTKVQPSQQGRRKGRNPEPRAYTDRYDHRSVGHAIRRACERAGVPPWHAHQLRHAAATEIRAKFGIEAARAVLGHASLAMADHYAEIDAEKAAEAMKKIG